MFFKSNVFRRMTQHVAHWAKPWRSRALGGLFLVSMVVAIALNACSLGQSKSLQPLKIGITTWPGFDIALYAQEAGLFEKRGLDVDIVRFENQQDAARAVLRGALDGAFASLWDVVQTDPGNTKPSVILISNISYGSDGMVTRPEIKTVEDLRGKRVGAKLGTVNHLILLEALKLHNLQPDEVTIEDVSNDRAVTLLKEGKIDGAVVWEPMLSETRDAIQGNIVFTTREVDSLVIDTFMSNTETVKTKKAELTEFIAAWFDVMQAVETQPDDVYSIVGKKLGQDPAVFAQDYAGVKKGDIAMQQQMFQSGEGLNAAIAQISQLLKADPRAGRLPRTDVDINAELVTTAIEEWQP